MARSYKRDRSGRFAGGGGGGGGSKGGGKTPKTTSARGRAKSRETAARAAVKAGGGSKATKSLLTAQRARDFYKATGTGTKRSASKSSGGSKPAKAATKPAKMSKAPVSKAKQAYRAATGRAREARMLAGGATSTRGLGRRTDPGAQNIRRNVKAAQAAAAKVRAMERSRGVSKPRKRKG
jgi:hypothetical protein